MNDETKEMNLSEMLFNRDERLLDYITNLQNDLKYQKEMEDEYIEKHTKLLQDFTNLQEENERLKERCEKAIEYIKRTNCYGMRSGKTLLNKYLNDLLNILNGGDENE